MILYFDGSRLATLREFYYITPIENLSSIMKQGILSHTTIQQKEIQHGHAYDSDVVNLRRTKKIGGNLSLWNFANLYFQARNPMLYRIFLPPVGEKIVVLGIKKDVINLPGVHVSDGNAANFETKFFTGSDIGKRLPKIIKDVDLEYWKRVDGTKRTIMAECLIPDSIPPRYIEEVFVPNEESAEEVKKEIDETIPIIIKPEMFFQPKKRYSMTEKLSLVEGDMFFSRMQTQTVSVNIVGIMGAGLASRAKYQFPDVYVKYQDLCKNRILKMGRPYFYKRETSTDYELADDPSTLEETNETCFILFPTKRHWSENASSKAIEQGLEWVCDHYHEWGVKSLAMPALGCGLGRLSWRDIGPLMCKYLSNMDVTVEIYLPTERKIHSDWKTKEFLFPR
jgi:hypothetical protein